MKFYHLNYICAIILQKEKSFDSTGEFMAECENNVHFICHKFINYDENTGKKECLGFETAEGKKNVRKNL